MLIHTACLIQVFPPIAMLHRNDLHFLLLLTLGMFLLLSFNLLLLIQPLRKLLLLGFCLYALHTLLFFGIDIRTRFIDIIMALMRRSTHPLATGHDWENETFATASWMVKKNSTTRRKKSNSRSRKRRRPQIQNDEQL